MTPTEDLYTADDCFITTITGGKFYLDAPDFTDITAIGHALAMKVRFNGHCSKFYSIAEHSINVAQLMDKLETGDPFEGLMHDVTEAFLPDVCAPYKQKFREMAKFDKGLDALAREVYGLPKTISIECKRADIMMCFIEAYWLSPYKGEEYKDAWNLRPRALEFVNDFEPHGFLPTTGKMAFLQSYRKLALLKPNVPQLVPENPKNGLTPAV